MIGVSITLLEIIETRPDLKKKESCLHTRTSQMSTITDSAIEMRQKNGCRPTKAHRDMFVLRQGCSQSIVCCSSVWQRGLLVLLPDMHIEVFSVPFHTHIVACSFRLIQPAFTSVCLFTFLCMRCLCKLDVAYR